MADTIGLKRDCEAIRIPSGERIQLPKGTDVLIMQSLGNNYTISTLTGELLRIDGYDADALGLRPTPLPELPRGPLTKDLVEAYVWEELKNCYDPEIPVNIVDLGLIYMCEVTPLYESGYKVDIRMTLTAPGCGMGDVLKADVESKLRHVAQIKEYDVQIVFDPPWDQERMTEAAKLQLNLM